MFDVCGCCVLFGGLVGSVCCLLWLPLLLLRVVCCLLWWFGVAWCMLCVVVRGCVCCLLIVDCVAIVCCTLLLCVVRVCNVFVVLCIGVCCSLCIVCGRCGVLLLCVFVVHRC